MTGTIRRGKAVRADLALWDGKTSTYSRVDATGGTTSGLTIGNDIDVLQVFGSGTDKTRASISTAISHIGTDSVALAFAPGTWVIDDDLTVPGNFTCHVPAGCVFSVSSGKTLTLSGEVIAGDSDTWYTGSGTVIVSRGGAHGGSYHRTAAERTALVTPTHLNYPEGALERYGATGDGSADDATAFGTAALVAAQGVQLFGTRGRTYKLNSAVTCGSIFDLDLRGATIKPGNNAGRITSTAATATATTTVSSGASLGSRSVVVASATGLAVGHDVLISATDFPNFWAKITSISGTTIEFGRTLPSTYSGTINLVSYAALPEQVSIINGVFDGTNVTGSAGNSGQALRLLNFKRVTLDGLRIANYTTASGANRPIHIADCIDVLASNIRAVDNDIGNSDDIMFITGARKAVVSKCLIDGGGFGFNIERSETGIATANALSGRRKYEDEESLATHSVRGIKLEACGYALAEANDISDFETGIKIENFHRFVVTGNTLRNLGLFTYAGQSAIGATSTTLPAEPYGIISNNLIENVGGIAVMIDTSGASTTDANVIVSGNVIKDCGRHAVYCGQQKMSVIGNRIENWNTSNTGSGTTSAAIYQVGGGINAVGNYFENSDATDCCFNVAFVSGQSYNFRDNARPSGNPEFNGGLQITEKSITINIGAAATSNSGAHGLVRTPSQSEIDLECATNTTNDPGILFVTAIDSTNITVACRAAPGATTMNVHAKLRIRMPFTA